MRNDYTDYLYHSKFFNSDGSKKDHKYKSRKLVNGKWQYIYKEVKDTAYKVADKITGGKLTEAHNKKFDAHMADLKSQRESGYSQEAKKKVEEQKAKLESAKKEVALNKRQADLKDKREKGYASEEKKKEEYMQKKLAEAKSVKKTKDMNAAADKRAESIANEQAKKQQMARAKRELDQYDKAEWHRKAAVTYFDLDNLNTIGRKDVGTTLEETAKVNPDYDDTNPATSRNCGFCAIAWVMRKKGYDVQAKADDENVTWNDTPGHPTGVVFEKDTVEMFVDPDRLGKGDKIDATNGVSGTNNALMGYANSPKVNALFGYYYISNKAPDKTAESVEKAMLEKGKDGSYGIMSVAWTDGGGHELNYQIENGKVIIYDGQVNESYPISDLVDRCLSIGYIDCTSLIPTDNVNLVVQNRRKS